MKGNKEPLHHFMRNGTFCIKAENERMKICEEAKAVPTHAGLVLKRILGVVILVNVILPWIDTKHFGRGGSTKGPYCYPHREKAW